MKKRERKRESTWNSIEKEKSQSVEAKEQKKRSSNLNNFLRLSSVWLLEDRYSFRLNVYSV